MSVVNTYLLLHAIVCQIFYNGENLLGNLLDAPATPVRVGTYEWRYKLRTYRQSGGKILKMVSYNSKCTGRPTRTRQILHYPFIYSLKCFIHSFIRPSVLFTFSNSWSLLPLIQCLQASYNVHFYLYSYHLLAQQGRFGNSPVGTTNHNIAQHTEPEVTCPLVDFPACLSTVHHILYIAAHLSIFKLHQTSPFTRVATTLQSELNYKSPTYT